MNISLQQLRAIAAILVVIQHSLHELRREDGSTVQFDGVFGVMIFFAISGFIILKTSQNRIYQPGFSERFLISRTAKIVPLYWIFTMLWVAAALVLPTGAISSAEFTFDQLLKSLLFIPYPRPADGAYAPLLSLGWSLNYEMWFYMCFLAVSTVFKERYLEILIALLLFIVGANCWWGKDSILSFYGSNFVLLFIAGMISAKASCNVGVTIVPNWVFWAYSALILAVKYCFYPEVGGVESFALAVTLILFPALCDVEKNRVGSAVLTRIGDWSFSLYLSHVFVINFFVLVFRKTAPVPNYVYALELIIIVMSCVLASFIVFHLVERPFTVGATHLLSSIFAKKRA